MLMQKLLKITFKVSQQVETAVLSSIYIQGCLAYSFPFV